MCCTLDTVHKLFIVSSPAAARLFRWCARFYSIYTHPFCAPYLLHNAIPIIFLALIYILFALGEYLSLNFAQSVTTCWLTRRRPTFVYPTIHIRIFTAPSAEGMEFVCEWLMKRPEANQPWFTLKIYTKSPLPPSLSLCTLWQKTGQGESC